MKYTFHASPSDQTQQKQQPPTSDLWPFFSDNKKSRVCLISFLTSQIPINLTFALRCQVFICLPEVFHGSECHPSKWAGMHVAQDEMFLAIDHFRFVVRLFSPKHKNDPWGLFVDCPDNVVCEILPSLLLMRVWNTLAYCKNRVQQEDALGRPRGQVAMQWFWGLELNFIVVR